jgi:uncharacterized membrane protein
VTRIGAIVASWAVVHTVFTLRYAALYYKEPDGGADFNEDDKPTYVVAYLAFTTFSRATVPGARHYRP